MQSFSEESSTNCIVAWLAVALYWRKLFAHLGVRKTKLYKSCPCQTVL